MDNNSSPNRVFDIVGLGAFNIDLIVDGEGNTEDSEGALERDRLVELGKNGKPFLGGSAFNAISAVGQIKPTSIRLGMIGVSGTAEYGIPTHQETLTNLHIESLLPASDRSSGLCVSLATSNGRKLFVDPGANLQIADYLNDKEKRAFLLSQLQGARVIHVTSLFDRENEQNVSEAVASFLTDLKQNSPDTLISFDPGDLWASAHSEKAVSQIFRIADALFLNEQEFSKITNSVPSDREALKLLSSISPNSAVYILKEHRSVKLIHPSGVVAATIDQPNIVETIDPTGAGDAFAAGVLLALSSSRSLTEGATLGLKLAALQVSNVGNEGFKNTLKELEDLWSPKHISSQMVTNKPFLDSVRNHAGTIRVLAEAVIAIGIVVAAALTIPGKVRELTDVSYKYIATPKVIAYQYAYPVEGAQSQADGLLSYGERVRVKCRILDSGGASWLKLENQKWVKGSEFSPSLEEKEIELLSECE
ncbi:MAG: carbohydrate kinase family protein [Candidatus Thiodiazotropha sp. L084R]